MREMTQLIKIALIICKDHLSYILKVNKFHLKAFSDIFWEKVMIKVKKLH
jgi:hypothetical protein